MEMYPVSGTMVLDNSLLNSCLVSFTLPESSPVVIVLSQITDRYFTEISGRYKWTFDFVLFRKGEKDYIAQSSHTRMYARSVNLEANLWPGEYVVHVRALPTLTPTGRADM